MQPNLFDAYDPVEPAADVPSPRQEQPQDATPLGAPQDRLVFATDGSCLGNPGPGGWAAAVVIADRWADKERWIAGGEDDTTNNRMELHAIATVLNATRDHGGEVVIQTDSRYSIDCVTKWVHGWKKKGWKTSKGEAVKNQDLVQLIDALLEHRRQRGAETRFVWVKGHAGQEANEFVDERARRVATVIGEAGGQLPTGPGLGG